MNNDLISREALREALKEYKYCGFYDKVIEIIDNAPTVDTSNAKNLEERDADAYETGYLDGHVDGYLKAEKDYARTQGEWKLVSDINNDIDVACPFCNERRIICYAHGYSIEEVKLQLQEVNNLPNYCENCGAKMKGGADLRGGET